MNEAGVAGQDIFSVRIFLKSSLVCRLLFLRGKGGGGGRHDFSILAITACRILFQICLSLALQDFLGGELSPHLRLFLMVRPVGAKDLSDCVTAFRMSSSAVGLSCTGLKCHAYCYEFNTAKRSFIHVCLLIALFSILVFGCLESDDRSCRRLRHCSLVNSSIK